ncbi:MAG: hypothetical protein HC872_03500 [Gammaproteobacteria bacterium]|nr:hypothetical protein [Gammaproteobacteria bacterium]
MKRLNHAQRGRLGGQRTLSRHGHHHFECIGRFGYEVTLERHFAGVETTSVPYLYRYLVPVLARSEEGARVIEGVLQEEGRQASSGSISLIGRRVVANRR